MSEEELIRGCLKEDSGCQKELFERYASKMYGVCLRYSKDREEAQDFLQEGFIKIFERLNQFRFEGSFEGWIRRIMVNTSLRKKKMMVSQTRPIEDKDHFSASVDANALQKLEHQDLLNLISQLPEGYKIIFNLFAIEGYNHKEIADMLNINEGTSRSQFFRARKWILNELSKLKG